MVYGLSTEKLWYDRVVAEGDELEMTVWIQDANLDGVDFDAQLQEVMFTSYQSFHNSHAASGWLEMWQEP